MTRQAWVEFETTRTQHLRVRLMELGLSVCVCVCVGERVAQSVIKQQQQEEEEEPDSKDDSTLPSSARSTSLVDPVSVEPGSFDESNDPYSRCTLLAVLLFWCRRAWRSLPAFKSPAAM